MSFDIDAIMASLEQPSEMDKQASAAPEADMTKEAAREYGRALAQSLIKQANQINEDQAAIAATQAAQTQPTPDGSIDDVLRALAAQAEQGGGVDEDPDLEALLARVAANLSPNPAAPGQGKLLATESSPSDVEKVAALAELIDSGVDYDTASEIVKEASAGEKVDAALKTIAEKAKAAGGFLKDKAKAGGALAMAHKKSIGLAAGGAAVGAGAMHLYNKRKDQEKQAALSELMDAGMDFDTASEIVKEASAGEKVDAALKTIAEKAKAAGGFLKDKAKAGGAWTMAHKKGIGLAAGGAAAGAGAMHLYNKRKEQEKHAALSELMDAGMDFDTASEIVKEASAGEVVDAAGRKAMAAGTYLWDKAKAGGALVAAHKKAIGLAAGGAAAGAGVAHLLHKRKDQEKKAALAELMDAGVDFDTASDIIKEATAGEVVDAAGRKAMAAGTYLWDKAKAGGALVAAHKKAIGLAAGGAAAGAGAMHLLKKRKEQEKKASFDSLVEAGVDFDTASEIVSDAYQE